MTRAADCVVFGFVADEQCSRESSDGRKLSSCSIYFGEPYTVSNCRMAVYMCRLFVRD